MRDTTAQAIYLPQLRNTRCIVRHRTGNVLPKVSAMVELSQVTEFMDDYVVLQMRREKKYLVAEV